MNALVRYMMSALHGKQLDTTQDWLNPISNLTFKMGLTYTHNYTGINKYNITTIP
jgi:hypothetical protein